MTFSWRIDDFNKKIKRFWWDRPGCKVAGPICYDVRITKKYSRLKWHELIGINMTFLKKIRWFSLHKPKNYEYLAPFIDDLKMQLVQLFLRGGSLLPILLTIRSWKLNQSRFWETKCQLSNKHGFSWNINFWYNRWNCKLIIST